MPATLVDGGASEAPCSRRAPLAFVWPTEISAVAQSATSARTHNTATQRVRTRTQTARANRQRSTAHRQRHGRRCKPAAPREHAPAPEQTTKHGMHSPLLCLRTANVPATVCGPSPRDAACIAATRPLAAGAAFRSACKHASRTVCVPQQSQCASPSAKAKNREPNNKLPARHGTARHARTARRAHHMHTHRIGIWRSFPGRCGVKLVVIVLVAFVSFVLQKKKPNKQTKQQGYTNINNAKGNKTTNKPLSRLCRPLKQTHRKHTNYSGNTRRETKLTL